MKLGFIGCGNMASAIIGGILEKEIAGREDITASTKSEESAAKIKEKLGIACGTDNRKTAETSDIVFLAVKPQFLEEAIAEIKDVLCSSQLIISIAAGKTMDWLEEASDTAVVMYAKTALQRICLLCQKPGHLAAHCPNGCRHCGAKPDKATGYALHRLSCPFQK